MSPNPVVLLIARTLLAAVFLVFGVRYILAFAVSVAYFSKLGFPAAQAMVALAIAIQLLAGIALIVGWKARWAAWLLVVYVVVATLMAHRFWEYAAPAYVNQMQHFLKNLAIIGGLIILAVVGPGRHSLDKY